MIWDEIAIGEEDEHAGLPSTLFLITEISVLDLSK